MTADQLKPHRILRGPLFPEPVEVLVASPMAGAVKLVGRGVQTNKVVDIQNGVANGFFAYVGKTAKGDYSPFVFAQPLMTGDIEFSDEMFLIKKEVAEEYMAGKTKPKGPLSRISIMPDGVRLQPNGQQVFKAIGFDASGSELPLPEIKWSADGGKIDPTGKFVAGKADGKFSVTATVGSLTSSASITIAKDAPPPPPPESPSGFVWTGEIPPQKWMNFYTKVLSKFAAGQGLKLKLNVEVKPEGGISKQRLEETKAALRELGLDDDLNSL